MQREENGTVLAGILFCGFGGKIPAPKFAPNRKFLPRNRAVKGEELHLKKQKEKPQSLVALGLSLVETTELESVTFRV